MAERPIAVGDRIRHLISRREGEVVRVLRSSLSGADYEVRVRSFIPSVENKTEVVRWPHHAVERV